MADERIQTASQFLLQAPPGEINDVLNDVRNIIADDDALQTGLLPALREYNLAQFTVADVPGTEHQTIVSEAARVVGDEDEERFLDPRSKQTFRFDHLALEASDPKPHEPQADTETFRLDLENASQVYLSGHYRSGVAAVLSPSSSANQYIIQLVANKYNPSNFWSGRWRSEYTLDTHQKTLTGRVFINVHYYEQGNVQLESNHSLSLPLPASINIDAASASKIFAIIESEESKFQNNLNDTYRDMGESTFKALRRALPLTRQKLDWDKVLGYKLGAELTAQNAGGVGH